MLVKEDDKVCRVGGAQRGKKEVMTLLENYLFNWVVRWEALLPSNCNACTRLSACIVQAEIS